MKPRIGLSSCFFHPDPERPVFKGKRLGYYEESLAHWLQDAGARVYLIPAPREGSESALAEYADELDALVLQGGSDVSPESYGETPLRPEWRGDRFRDLYEMKLLKEFRARPKPVLGVCRGLQLLNVAYGGTLYQDIATQLPSARCHRDWQIYDQNFHEIRWSEDSRLSRIYPGQRQGVVNTVHHQAIRELGRGLVPEAHSSCDELIEAVRSIEDPYVFGVQWHPEFQDATRSDLLSASRLANDFLEAIRLNSKMGSQSR